MDITRLEAMAKLNLQSGEREKIAQALVTLEKELDEFEHVETSNAEPLASVLDLQSVLREDVCIKLVERDELLQNAPEQYDGYFQVPGTLA